jgi:IstB-like ATP binding protein
VTAALSAGDRSSVRSLVKRGPHAECLQAMEVRKLHPELQAGLPRRGDRQTGCSSPRRCPLASRLHCEPHVSPSASRRLCLLRSHATWAYHQRQTPPSDHRGHKSTPDRCGCAAGSWLHRCEFLEDANNVVLVGGPGTGKRHLATAIEHHRKRVRSSSRTKTCACSRSLWGPMRRSDASPSIALGFRLGQVQGPIDDIAPNGTHLPPNRDVIKAL